MVVATIGRVGRSKIGIHSATNKWNIMSKSSCYKRSLVVFIVPRGDSMGCICAANQRIAGIRFVSQGVADIIEVVEIWVDDAGVDDTRAGDIGVAIVADVAIIGIEAIGVIDVAITVVATIDRIVIGNIHMGIIDMIIVQMGNVEVCLGVAPLNMVAALDAALRIICMQALPSKHRSAKEKKKNLPGLSCATMHGICIWLQAKRRIDPIAIHGNRCPEKEGVG